MGSSKDIGKLVAKTALLIGLPCGISFTAGLVMLLISHPIHIEVSHTEYDHLWLPATTGLMVTLGLILWMWKGKKIKVYIDRDFSLVKSSFPPKPIWR